MSGVNRQLLGGLTPSAFLRRHWQKQPLLVRGAMPGFDGLLDFHAMAELACQDECESRLIVRDAGGWSVEHGPFTPKRLSRLPVRNWTLLLQGLDRILPAARQLLSHFDFIPYSRLDDLMVSYAPAGGGVGAHFDSYDVFLLQGPGQRRWQVSKQRDLGLVENAPLKILKRFSPEGECLVRAGDMLYLPPAFAHDGIAVDACYTYSIGFRAPSHRELLSQFLIFLEDRLTDDGRYGDPDLSVPSHPAQIGAGMLTKVQRILGEIRWSRRQVTEFLGAYLTEPKQHVIYFPPQRPQTEAAFSAAARHRGVELALTSQMLYGNTMFFINGEPNRIAAALAAPMRRLADRRRLAGREIPRHGAVADMLYRWYRAGYIYLSR